MTSPFTVRPLDASTWEAFAELVERNNGVFGGCWCMGYHPERGQRGIIRREIKEDRVRTGRAHAALVIDERGAAQGWCQYGDPEELPGIKHRREYDKDAPPRPDWRITCFYVAAKHRADSSSAPRSSCSRSTASPEDARSASTRGSSAGLSSRWVTLERRHPRCS